MKATITILRGTDKIITGTLVARTKHYADEVRPNEAFAEDLINIERYINTQGAYRCHIETTEHKGTQP